MSSLSMSRLSICAAAIALLSVASAAAAPAYVPSTVNLRGGAGTANEILAKIPGGSLVDAANCADGWCEVEWQGKKGFAIETALDRSGRVSRARPVAARPVGPGPAIVAGPGPVVVGPPLVVGGPLLYPYGPPYAYGYYGPRRYYGYRRYYRRW
jgi:uncharacterized protein YraI